MKVMNRFILAKFLTIILSSNMAIAASAMYAECHVLEVFKPDLMITGKKVFKGGNEVLKTGKYSSFAPVEAWGNTNPELHDITLGNVKFLRPSKFFKTVEGFAADAELKATKSNNTYTLFASSKEAQVKSLKINMYKDQQYSESWVKGSVEVNSETVASLTCNPEVFEDFDHLVKNNK